MFNSKYIVFNGEFISVDTFSIKMDNRAFRYGDSIFETMFASFGKIRFLEKHYERLKNGMKVLKYDLSNNTFSYEKIRKETLMLINKNRYYYGTRIRLTVFRRSGGFYTLEDNNINYLIETLPVKNILYELNKKGLVIGIYKDIKKTINKLSYYKTGNSLLFVLAGVYKREKNFDDCIILNEKNNICETISSNIFIVKGNNIFTPGLGEGFVNGIMRGFVIKNAVHLGYNIIEKKDIKTSELIYADEIFLTNSISGIKWVVGFEEKRYFNRIAKKLTALLNKEIENL